MAKTRCATHGYVSAEEENAALFNKKILVEQEETALWTSVEDNGPIHDRYMGHEVDHGI